MTTTELLGDGPEDPVQRLLLVGNLIAAQLESLAQLVEEGGASAHTERELVGLWNQAAQRLIRQHLEAQRGALERRVRAARLLLDAEDAGDARH